jgi:hypothetical protein
LFQKLKNFLRPVMLHDGPVHQCFSSSRPQEDAAALATAVIPPSMTRCDVERRSPTGDIAPGTCSPTTLTTWPTRWTTSFRGVPKMCPQEKQARAKTHPDLLILWWSCRESNPGPTAFPQGFSVRSSLCLYSDLPVTQTSRDDDPSRCECPDESRDRTHRLIPLADARVRAEGAPGLTD